MKKSVFLLIAAFCMLFSAQLVAQNNGPSPSPTCTISQKVGMTDVSIVYSRPGKKDRVIFAEDGLVPYGKPWRTGANAATKISFGDDVTLGGQKLAKGDYAILTVPGANEWKVMLYAYDSTNWGSYVDKDPVASFTAKPSKLGDITVETFMIDIGNVRDTSATIGLVWTDVYVPLPLTVK
jgi:hypothetical protein